MLHITYLQVSMSAQLQTAVNPHPLSPPLLPNSNAAAEEANLCCAGNGRAQEEAAQIVEVPCDS